MQVLKDNAGVDYVAVEDLVRWLQGHEDAVVAECSGAPDGCTETRAYLYGEICSLRILRKTVSRWKASETPPAVDAVDPPAGITAE